MAKYWENLLAIWSNCTGKKTKLSRPSQLENRHDLCTRCICLHLVDECIQKFYWIPCIRSYSISYTNISDSPINFIFKLPFVKWVSNLSSQLLLLLKSSMDRRKRPLRVHTYAYTRTYGWIEGPRSCRPTRAHLSRNKNWRKFNEVKAISIGWYHGLWCVECVYTYIYLLGACMHTCSFGFRLALHTCMLCA